MIKHIVLALVFVAGCGGQPATSEVVAADTTPPTATLSFAADWSVTQSAPVVAGGRATIHYDPARLPSCRATYNGLPAWAIAAYWSVDGGPASSQAVTTGGAAKDLTFDVEPGHDLAVWFENSDEYGCLQWDSNYGQNFHFALAAGDPAVRFSWPGWAYTQLAPLRAGGEFIVDFDIRRLPYCRQDYNRLPTWDVTVGWRFDDGTSGSASVRSSFARITAPATANNVELWFENTDRTGCQTWDSAYGNNYRFAIER